MTVRMKIDEWIKEFQPKANHLSQYEDYDFGNGSCLFQSYTPDVNYIYELKDAGSTCIWTIRKDAKGTFITEGYHFIDRIGYIVTEKPYIPGEMYIIDIDE